MRLAYVQRGAGISGAGFLSALLDLGVSLAAVQEGWQHLQLPAAQVALERVALAEVTATRLIWTAPDLTPFLARFPDDTLTAHVARAELSPRVRQRLLAVLERFADAVRQLHEDPVRGRALAAPFWADVLYMGSGVATALDALKIDRLLAAPLNLGRTPHPLVVALARGLPVYGETSEASTSVDGAALLTGLAAQVGALPDMALTAAGYGVGIDTAGDAHPMQVLLGEVEPSAAADRIAVLEANIDDMNPEFYEMVFERLLAQGALDVTLTPMLMKKGRPANKLTVLAPISLVPRLSRLMLPEPSTVGVRVYEVWRQKLERFVRHVETRYGTIPVKCGVLEGRLLQAAPEFDACKQAAREHQVPVRLVYAEAARLAAAWLDGVSNQGHGA